MYVRNQRQSIGTVLVLESLETISGLVISAQMQEERKQFCAFEAYAFAHSDDGMKRQRKFNKEQTIRIQYVVHNCRVSECVFDQDSNSIIHSDSNHYILIKQEDMY